LEKRVVLIKSHEYINLEKLEKKLKDINLTLGEKEGIGNFYGQSHAYSYRHSVYDKDKNVYATILIKRNSIIPEIQYDLDFVGKMIYKDIKKLFHAIDKFNFINR
jgi:predicted DNA-binding transcriptional regulator